jgi:hypothetical protein
MRRVPLPPLVRLRGCGMRMPPSVVVHIHLQSRTVNYRRFTITLVTPSMDGTTPACYSTSPMRRWRPVPTRLSTLSTHVEAQDAEPGERAEMVADLEQQLLELQVQAPPKPVEHQNAYAMSGIDED